MTPTLNGITFKHDWAPDGSRLVMSDNADNPDLTVNVVTIRPDGTGLKYLTDKLPVWQGSAERRERRAPPARVTVCAGPVGASLAVRS